jgi:NADPH2:quinone reductase
MTHAVRIHTTGGPEALSWDEVDIGDPGEGEIRLKQTAVGLNYLDTYHRSGMYPVGDLPAVIGSEGAGVVDAVGPGISGIAAGDRVAYSMGLGAYAEVRLINAAAVVKIPDGVSDQAAASMMLKGCTAQYLMSRTYEVQKGDTILFHAAAGGVGLIACQWAKHLGATVIGTVGSEEKAELARANGCDHTIIYGKENFVERVREITGGAGVPVVYDSVGKDTMMGSLDCLRPRGLLALFGQSSGKPDPLDITMLTPKGSLYVTRPSLAHYIATREDLVYTANELFDVVAKGIVKVSVNQTYPLAETAQAHRDLEARKTTGSTVLVP